MNLPTEQQCEELFVKYKVPGNIRQHCRKVRDLAVFLAQKLHQSGEKVNIEFVERLALLHDLFKVVAIDNLGYDKFYNYHYSDEEIEMWKWLRQKYPNMHECDVAYLVFKDEFPQLAVALRDVSNTFKENKSIEENITHYADWRIFNDQVVSLAERLDYLKGRYKAEEEFWQKKEKLIKEKEEELFTKLNFNAEELKEELKNGG